MCCSPVLQPSIAAGSLQTETVQIQADQPVHEQEHAGVGPRWVQIMQAIVI